MPEAAEVFRPRSARSAEAFDGAEHSARIECVMVGRTVRVRRFFVDEKSARLRAQSRHAAGT